MTMGTAMAERFRGRALAIALCGAALASAGGCGSDDPAPEPSEPAVQSDTVEPAAEDEGGKPEAAKTTEVAKVAEPAKPEKLSLLDDGNPTVYVRLGQSVDLYDKPGGNVVETAGHRTEFGSRTVYAATDQKERWAAVLTPFTENGEPLWLKLDPERVKAGRVTWNLEVDLSEFETRLYDEGKLVRTFPVSIGMPTAPTPTGRFAITDTFRGGLNPAYGCCALATTARQVNLPSGWLGGDRIAFHGTTGALGAEISHGCVRAVDEDVSALVNRVPPGTPVEIHE